MSLDKRITIYANTTTSKYVTLETTTVAQTVTVNASRIMISSAINTHLVAFGTNPSLNVAANCMVIPAGQTLFFNFVSGEKIAVKAIPSGGNGHITILDMD
jgi:hypothetical protein